MSMLCCGFMLVIFSFSLLKFAAACRSLLASELISGIHWSSVPVLADEKSILVRTLVDHSIVESYAQGGRRCITSRVYPTQALDGAAKLFLFNNATTVVKVWSLNVWQMDYVSLRPYQKLKSVD